jgi:ketol-acid reductoisomerase
MRTLLAQVRDGSFAATMLADHERGFPWFREQRANLAAHGTEEAGRAVRSWMPWLGDDSPEASAND